MSRDSSWSPEEWVSSQGGTRLSNGQVVIEHNNDWLSVLRDDSVIDDFDDEERAYMLSLVGQPALFLIEWKGGEAAELLIRAIPADCAAAIDNDHGILDLAHRVREVPIKYWATASELPSSHQPQ